MKRMKFLFGQRRMQVLLTLAVLLLAASVVIGSGASFTSQSANPSNTFTAGTLTHTNSKAPAAVLTAGPLMPGDTSAPGTVIITNTGGAGNFRLFMTGLTDVHGDTIDPINGGTSDLSQTLDLHIVDDLSNTIYNNKLDAFPAAGVPAGPSAGLFAAGAARTYTFTVTFPDTDLGSSSATKGSDNQYKLCSSTVDFSWEAISN